MIVVRARSAGFVDSTMLALFPGTFPAVFLAVFVGTFKAGNFLPLLRFFLALLALILPLARLRDRLDGEAGARDAAPGELVRMR